MELLKSVTPEQLHESIKKNVDPWNAAPSKVKRRGSTWARKLRKYKDRLPPQLVIEWLKADRPDLGSLVENMGSKGTKWLARMTEGIKDRLWPPEERGLKLVREGLEEEEPPEEAEEIPAKVKWG